MAQVEELRQIQARDDKPFYLQTDAKAGAQGEGGAVGGARANARQGW